MAGPSFEPMRERVRHTLPTTARMTAEHRAYAGVLFERLFPVFDSESGYFGDTNEAGDVARPSMAQNIFPV